MIYYFIYTEELTILCPLVLKVWRFHYFTSEVNAIIQRQAIYIIYHTQCRFIVSIYQDEKRDNLSNVYLKHLVFGVYCTSIMFAKSFAYKVFFRCYSLKNVCHKTASCIYFKGKKITITSMISNDNYN